MLRQVQKLMIQVKRWYLANLKGEKVTRRKKKEKVKLDCSLGLVILGINVCLRTANRSSEVSTCCFSRKIAIMHAHMNCDSSVVSAKSVDIVALAIERMKH